MPHEQAPFRLSSLLASRLCHDLISPVGAIHNGLELLELSGTLTNAPEMELIQESCNSATARIRFYRLAFGHAEPQQQISSREVSACVTGMFSTKRLMVEWRDTQDRPRLDIRALLIALLCCETGLPHGGHICIETQGADWQLIATGGRANLDPAIWDRIKCDMDPEGLSADKLQFALLRPLSATAGRRPFMAAHREGFTVTLKSL